MGRGSSGLGGGAKGRTLREYGEGQYEVPFPVGGNKSDINEIARFTMRLGKYAQEPPVDVDALPIKTVDISDLVRTQDQLNKGTVDSLMGLPISQLNSGAAGGLPWVIKYNGTYQIQDGHHRLTALWAKGVKKVKVRVFDLNNL